MWTLRTITQTTDTTDTSWQQFYVSDIKASKQTLSSQSQTYSFESDNNSDARLLTAIIHFFGTWLPLFRPQIFVSRNLHHFHPPADPLNSYSITGTPMLTYLHFTFHFSLFTLHFSHFTIYLQLSTLQTIRIKLLKSLSSSFILSNKNSNLFCTLSSDVIKLRRI